MACTITDRSAVGSFQWRAAQQDQFLFHIITNSCSVFEPFRVERLLLYISFAAGTRKWGVQ
jgi:hypothetical protein